MMSSFFFVVNYYYRGERRKSDTFLDVAPYCAKVLQN